MGGPAITAVVLAGGQSRRMGADKADLMVDGQTVLERTVRGFIEVGVPVWVAGRARPADWPVDLDARFVPDDEPGAGPAAGLASAWRRVDGAVCTVPCDAPRLDAAALRWLLAAGAEGGVLWLDGRPQHAVVVWPSRARALLLAHVDAGRRSLAGAVEAASLPSLNPPAAHADAFRQANTPEEWAALVGRPVAGSRR